MADQTPAHRQALETLRQQVEDRMRSHDDAARRTNDLTYAARANEGDVVLGLIDALLAASPAETPPKVTTFVDDGASTGFVTANHREPAACHADPRLDAPPPADPAPDLVALVREWQKRYDELTTTKHRLREQKLIEAEEALFSYPLPTLSPGAMPPVAVGDETTG